MLTFEEFFAKKKIDLVQLQSAESVLFAEFSQHYALMGEKSFDHTKKYWFNKLRRTYPLAAAVKPHAVKAEAISDMAIQGIAAAAAQNLDQTLEKPKFTEDHLAELVDKNVPVKEVSLAEEEKAILESEGEKSEEKKSEERDLTTPKPAFKPRFNARNITKPEDVLEKNEEKKIGERKPAIESPKPAFKPRFNMQNMKKDPEENQSAASPDLSETKKEQVVSNSIPDNPTENLPPENTAPKPAFKPRFNMQNMKKEPVKEASETKAMEPATEIQEPAIQSEPLTENSTPETAPPKPVFKPRFNMQNMKKEPVKEASETKAEAMEPATENPEPATENIENKEAKPVYKPRFQMKNMPKPATENLPPAE